MANVLFISERSIKDNSIIETNVEPKIIRLTIKEVQDLELYRILGKDLYNKIENEIIDKKNGAISDYSDEVKMLLEMYVKDFIIYGVLLNIPNPLNYKYTNKGSVNITDDNALNINGSSIENVKKFYRSKFDAYRLRLVEFINETCGAKNDNPAPYSIGWHLKNEPNYQRIYNNKVNKLG